MRWRPSCAPREGATTRRKNTARVFDRIRKTYFDPDREDTENCNLPRRRGVAEDAYTTEASLAGHRGTEGTENDGTTPFLIYWNYETTESELGSMVIHTVVAQFK